MELPPIYHDACIYMYNTVHAVLYLLGAYWEKQLVKSDTDVGDIKFCSHLITALEYIKSMYFYLL